MATKDKFTRDWILSNSLEEIQNYDDGELTIRGLHYRLVSRGMTNTMRHYKRVVTCMIKARWEGIVPFETFSDHDREVIGETDIDETDPTTEAEDSKMYILHWLKTYKKNRWENQVYYPEVFIEKKALQGVFGPTCKYWNVALSACKGYPSLTFLKDAADRFDYAIKEGKTPIILYFGDYDPSGEDIPRSIKQNLWDMGVEVQVRRVSLMEHQVIEWGLPPAPAKVGDSRTANWNGLGQVELDAVEPEKIRELCNDALNNVFDEELHKELLSQQKEESKEYRSVLKNWMINLEEEDLE